MGMLLRHRPNPDEMTTTETMRKQPQKVEEKVAESVKDEKPKIVKRGRPTKK